MKQFHQEFHTLQYVISESEKVLLFAHSHPDGDTIGSVLSLKEYLLTLGKNVDIACFDPLPSYLESLTKERVLSPDSLNLADYKLIIACDSVERGFHKILDKISPQQVTAIIDHHPDITISGDINIIDPKFSSVCEIIYNFFIASKIEITRKMATYLMLGILSDTGTFQHSNTTPQVMEIASTLMKKGAPISKIIKTTFNSKHICTLRLWGRAFDKAKINPQNGMIATVLTQKDIAECQATTEDIAQVASILDTVPGTKFSLVLSEREGGLIKGSLRSEEYKGVDVSKIAAQFGGGGHKLASGFEIKGKIVETKDGWEII